MAGRALIIGGSGQVGRPAALRLVEAGWSVSVANRRADAAIPGAQSIQLDRQDDAAMDGLLKEGFDVVIDLLAFRSAHSAQLLRNAPSIGSLVMMSSAAVYQDDQGRTLQGAKDEASSPVFDGLLDETATTVEPDATSYAGNKRAVEIALLESAIPTTVIRPAGIHGAGSPQPREWFYVKRFLDGRRVALLGYQGRSALHPVSANNLAHMIALAASHPGAGILNAGDPGLPDEREIVAAIAETMDHSVTQVLIDGMAPMASPWSLPVPFLLSTRRAEDTLGYRPVETYRQSVRADVESIVAELERGTFLGRLSERFGPPGLGVQVFAGGGAASFDYAAEDKIIAERLG